ncbi:hypothetical protein [Holospora undulata]|nr:hypothetical protein [Holospora undulata]
MEKKILLMLIMNVTSSFFIENFAQSAYGADGSDEDSSSSSQQSSELSRGYGGEQDFFNQLDQFRELLSFDFKGFEINFLYREADTLDHSLVEAFTSENNNKELECFPFEAEILDGEYASNTFLGRLNGKGFFIDILNRNSSDATALKRTLQNISPKKLFDTLFGLNKNTVKYVLRVLNHDNPDSFNELFVRLLTSLDFRREKRYSDQDFSSLRKAFMVLVLAFNSEINVDAKKIYDALSAFEKDDSLKNILLKLSQLDLSQTPGNYLNIFHMTAALGRIAAYNDTHLGGRNTIADACEAIFENIFSLFPRNFVFLKSSLRDLSFGTPEDVVWTVNALALSDAVNKDREIYCFLSDALRFCGRNEVTGLEGVLFSVISRDCNTTLFTQVLDFTLKNIKENRIRPKVLGYIFEYLMRSNSKTNKEIAFDFLSKVVDTPDNFTCVLRSLFCKEGAFSETLNNLSSWCDQYLFDKAFSIFIEDYEHLFKEVNNCNSTVLFRVFSFLEKDTRWKEKISFPELIEKVRINNSRNLTDAIYILLRGNYNYDEYACALDFFNAAPENSLKSDIFQELRRASPETASEVFSRVFDRVIENLSNSSDEIDKSRRENLWSVAADQLKEIDVVDKEIYFYTKSNEKIYLGTLNNISSFNKDFIKYLMKNLPQSQKMRFLNQAVAEVLENLEKSPYWIRFDNDYVSKCLDVFDIADISYEYCLDFLSNTQKEKYFFLKKFSELRPNFGCEIFNKILEKFFSSSDPRDIEQYNTLQRVAADLLERGEIIDQELHFYTKNNEKIIFGQMYEENRPTQMCHFIKGVMPSFSKKEKMNAVERVILKNSDMKTWAHYLDMADLSYREVLEQLERSSENKQLPNMECFLKFRDLEKDQDSKKRQEALIFFDNASKTALQSQSLLFCLKTFCPENYFQNVEDLKNLKFKVIVDALKESEKRKRMQIRQAREHLNKFFWNRRTAQNSVTGEKDFSVQLEYFINKVFSGSDLEFIPTREGEINLIIDSILYDQSGKEEYNELYEIVTTIIENQDKDYELLHKALEDFGIFYKNLKDPKTRYEAISGFFHFSNTMFCFFEATAEAKDTTNRKFLEYLGQHHYDSKKCKTGEELIIKKVGEKKYAALLAQFNYAAETKQVEENLIRQNARKFIIKNLSEILHGIKSAEEESKYKAVKQNQCTQKFQEEKEDLQYFKIASFGTMKAYLKGFSEKYYETQDVKQKEKYLDEMTEIFMDVYDGKERTEVNHLSPLHYQTLRKNLPEAFAKNTQEYVENAQGYKNDLLAYGSYARLTHFLEGAVDEGAGSNARCADGLLSDAVKTIAEMHGYAFFEEEYSKDLLDLGLCKNPKKTETFIALQNR